MNPSPKPAAASPAAKLSHPAGTVTVTGDLREQACALVEEAAHRLADSGAVEAAWFLRGVVDGMTGSPDQSVECVEQHTRYAYKAGYATGDAADESGRGF